MWTRAPAGTHPIKTPVELPDKLLISAKTLAAQRRTTLKAMGKSALRWEVATQENLAPDSCCKVGWVGILSLQKLTEAPTGDPVMRELTGNRMRKTSR